MATSKKAKKSAKTSTEESSTVKPKAKRRPKGFVSLSLETASILSLHAMWHGYMAAYTKGMTVEEIFKQFDNEQWLEEMRPVYKEFIRQSLLFTCCAPFIEEIRKNKRSNRILMWQYAFVRFGYVTGNMLENPMKPSPSENDEIMVDAYKLAFVSDEEFRKLASSHLQIGKEHFANWLCDQREECIMEFRRIFKKYRTAIKVYQELLEKLELEDLDNEQFDKK